MATKAITIIDIDGREDLSRLVDELGPSVGHVILRREGLHVAVVTPLSPASRVGAPLPHKVITDEDRAASRAALGGWAGNVDIDRLRDAIRESRSLPSRPPVTLDL